MQPREQREFKCICGGYRMVSHPALVEKAWREHVAAYPDLPHRRIDKKAQRRDWMASMLLYMGRA